MTTNQHAPRVLHGLSHRRGSGLTGEQMAARSAAERQRIIDREAAQLAERVEAARQLPSPPVSSRPAEVKRIRAARSAPPEPEAVPTLTPADLKALRSIRERIDVALTYYRTPTSRKDS